MPATTSYPRPQRLLGWAHHCLSYALQYDYLSPGAMTPVGTATRTPLARHARHDRHLPGNPSQRRLSSGEEYRLIVSARRGDLLARQRLITSQLGLVMLIARPYRNRELPLQDLVAEGSIGLMTAIDKFDPERGCRFSTYAKWWIRQAIELALLTQGRIVRVPVRVGRALKRSKWRLREHPLDAPSTGHDSPEHKAAHSTAAWLLYQASVTADDADASGSDSPAPTVLDRIAAPEHDQPDWDLQQANLHWQLQAALMTLNANERVVIESRFGWEEQQVRTLQSIADELHISSERVRQIQAEALGKLRRLLERTSGTTGCDALLD